MYKVLKSVNRLTVYIYLDVKWILHLLNISCLSNNLTIFSLSITIFTITCLLTIYGRLFAKWLPDSSHVWSYVPLTSQKHVKSISPPHGSRLVLPLALTNKMFQEQYSVTSGSRPLETLQLSFSVSWGSSRMLKAPGQTTDWWKITWRERERLCQLQPFWPLPLAARHMSKAMLDLPTPTKFSSHRNVPCRHHTENNCLAEPCQPTES